METEKKVLCFLKMGESTCTTQETVDWGDTGPVYKLHGPRLQEGASKKWRFVWKFDCKCVCMYYIKHVQK